MYLSEALEDENYEYLYSIFESYPSYEAFYDNEYDDLIRSKYGFEVLALACEFYNV